MPRCSAAADAHSVAISLIEAMGARWREVPLRVYSTDSNRESLARARRGLYPRSAVRGPSERVRRFFEEEAGGLRVRPFVRDACSFAILDPAKPLPFLKLDLIASRATLAGLAAAEGEKALRSFHSALAPGGLLSDATRIAGGLPELFEPMDAAGTFAARLSSQESPDLVAQLQDSDDGFKLCFSGWRDALLLSDPKTGRIVDANEAARRLFGFILPELLELRVRDLAAPAHAVRRPENERRSQERLAMPHFRRKDGSFFPAEAQAYGLKQRGRRVELWTVRDATERLRSNGTKRREEEHNAFLGEVIHELRTPMTVIRGSAETLRRGEQSKWTRNKFLRVIENQTARMAGMVDTLLDLNAAKSIKRHTRTAPVPVAEAVWDLVPNFLAVAKRRGIRINVDIPGSLSVLADLEDFRHILGNLVDNALKYNHRGGQVRVVGRREGASGIVAVQDTGSGIPPDDLERIFERFYRTERTRRVKGNGLGLAIVRGMVEANGGSIKAENNPAGGSIFRVTLPLAACETKGRIPR